MSELMWSGGAEQFQDRYPYVWFIMGEFNRGPFYPTDPPRDPGAFYDSVSPLLDFPVLGAAYAPFVSQYAIYYAEQWQLNPPATSTSTGNAPTLDADTSIGEKLDSIITKLDFLQAGVGGYSSERTLLQDVTAIWAQLSGGQTTPPPVATIRDTNIILAALYYIAQSVVVPAWSIDNSEVLAAIDATEDVITGQADDHDTVTQGKLDSMGSSLVTIDSVVDTVNVNVSAVSVDLGEVGDVADAILDLLGDGLPPAEAGPSGYPGASGVTLSIPRSFSGPLEHTEAMDGCIVHLTTIPSGTGHQTVNGHTSWQHMGWLAFLADDDLADELQWLNVEDAVYTPKRIANPTGILLFPRAGSGGTMTPWVRTV